VPLLRVRGLRIAAAAAVIAAAAGSGHAAAKAETAVPAKNPYKTSCATPDLDSGARTCSYRFEYTGNIDTFVVPPTTAPVQITVVGAPGAGKRGFKSRGATVTGSFPSLGGVPIFVTVGGDGGVDGFNGGGVGGGGGASDVRLGAPDLEHRIIVAGGGGGWGEQLVFDEDLGTQRLVLVKGGDAGQPGMGSGGQPGTGSDGGKGGGTEYGPGQPGSFGRGGSGGGGGGGGGGGLYGGGGGGGCAGTDGEGIALCLDSQPGSGGGGSSLVPAGGSFVLADDLNPSVTITVTQYGAPYPDPTVPSTPEKPSARQKA
jgi:hypothetical protein